MKETGSTLIEVLAAVLLTAVMTSAVFSVALGAKGESKITEEHNSASQCITQLTNELHSFVTGYWSYGTNSFNPVMPEICGPESSGCVYGGGNYSQWTWASSGVTDSCSGCYALSTGVHTLTVQSNGLTGFNVPFCMTPWMWQPPYSANLSYTVTPPPISSGQQVGGPGVSVTINWKNQ